MARGDAHTILSCAAQRRLPSAAFDITNAGAASASAMRALPSLVSLAPMPARALHVAPFRLRETAIMLPLPQRQRAFRAQSLIFAFVILYFAA